MTHWKTFRIRLALAALVAFAAPALRAQVTITTEGVASSTSTTAVVTWTTTGTPATASSQVIYGLGGSLSSATILDGTLVTSHSVTLTGLRSGVVYSYAARSVNAAGQVTTGATQTFALCSAAGAGQTRITATLNTAYEYGLYTATYTDDSGIGGTATVCGSAVPATVSGSFDLNGNLSATIPDSNYVTPSPSHWAFAVTSSAGTNGPIGAFSSNQTITGASQDIGAALRAAAVGKLEHVYYDAATTTFMPTITAGGGGTVSSFSAGTLSPLFTTSVATATTTPALSFTISTAGAHTFYGNNTGSTAAPGFQSIGTADLPTAIPIGNVGSAGLSGTSPITINAAGAIGCATCNTSSAAVTSVAQTVNGGASSGIFAVTGSPVTTVGTIDLGLTLTSGGIPYASSTTVLSSSALLTSNSPVLGGGAGFAPKTATFLTTDGTTELDIGPADTTNNGILGLKGKTSGTFKITAPAVAGTTTNGATVSNVLLLPDGSTSAPAYSFTANAGSGLFESSGSPIIARQGANIAGAFATGWQMTATLVTGWGSSAIGGAFDTAISRDSVGVIDVGTGAAGSKAGSMNMTNLTASGFVSANGTIVNLSIPAGTATFTGGTGITSVACASGFSCNNTRGTLTIVGGTGTTGTIATVTFSAALSAAPACFASMNGGATVFSIGNSAPTTTAFNITAGISVVGATFNVNYQCQP